MAVLFTHQLFVLIFLFLFFLPQLSFSYCPTSIPCGDPNIEIYPPFYATTNNGGDPLCNGTYLIQCNGRTPTIQFEDIKYGILNYTVKNISYEEDKTITVQPPDLDTFYGNSRCSFLYNFRNPIRHFEVPHPYFINLFDVSSMPCKWGKHDFPVLGDNYHYSVCKDFSFYYSTTESQEGLSSMCRAPEAPRIEYKLSFANNDDGLSVLLIGFSNSLKLDPSCFQDNVCNNDAVINRHKKIIIGATMGFAGILFIILLLLCLCSTKFHKYILWRKKSNGSQNVEAFLEKYGTLAPKRYTYSNVKKMTHSFDDKLGQGGYGSVFKGSLSDGRFVAVKVLKISNGNGEEFVNEIASIGRSSHVNIVNLLGFCSEGSKRAIIYEYMCNGSLDKLLCSEKPKTTLDWERLYQIAIGIARGLEYLHRGCNTRIVHFDIKPHNILLDKDFCPKISDFGLAKLCLRKDSILSMEGMRGTIGYIAPEVFSRNFGVVSSKSDIYSYGMMVLEMAGGRKNMHLDAQNTSDNYFPHYIYKYLEENEDLLTYDVTVGTKGLAKKMILIGLWCIQTQPQNRPAITRVIEMWEGSVDDLQIPPKPNLSLPTTLLVSDICSSSNYDGGYTYTGDYCSAVLQ